MPARTKKSTAPKRRPLIAPALTLKELKRPAPEDEARLLKAAARLWEMKPWETWFESEIFAVQNPEDGRLGFVSVLGAGGEQFGVLVYDGPDALVQMLDLQERLGSSIPSELPDWIDDPATSPQLLTTLSDLLAASSGPPDEVDPMELLQIPQLQLMYETRRDLEPLDKGWLKRHNYKASGCGYPTFRSLVPGYLPWFVSKEEVHLLATALEQLIEVASRLDFDSDVLETKIEWSKNGTPSARVFARVPYQGKDGVLCWRDETLKVSPDATDDLRFLPDPILLERIAALPPSSATFEMEVIQTPIPIAEKDARPYLPSVVMGGSYGMVAAIELVPCGFGPHMLAPLVQTILKILSEQIMRPALILYSSPEMLVLEMLGKHLGIKVQRVEELETLDPAIESFAQTFSAGQSPNLPDNWSAGGDKPILH